MNGGYDDGYHKCACFWGKQPGSLVQQFIAGRKSLEGTTVLDLGCGEGKNAFALAHAGAEVVAVDCSQAALANGKRELDHPQIQWVLADAIAYIRDCPTFDLIVMYGLLHCMPDREAIESIVRSVIERTCVGGHNILVAFNDGPHDLRAHPEFSPTLISHESYLALYRNHELQLGFSDILREVHPHNGIPHFHSITRILARKST